MGTDGTASRGPVAVRAAKGEMEITTYYVHEAQLDGMGGKAHQYRALRGPIERIAQALCNRWFVADIAQLVPAPDGWPRCKKCAKRGGVSS
mgnify:CR=1 FL=1